MKYDFETLLERHGKDAIAVDAIGQPGGFAPAGPKEGFDAIPMWVADMNFATCPAIQQAVIDRVRHPAFGYFEPSEEYFRAIIRWQEKRNWVSGLEPRHIGYENGVLGGVVSTLNVLCTPNVSDSTKDSFDCARLNNGAKNKCNIKINNKF